MVERYDGEPLPPVHPDPYGRLPHPDGNTIPQPPPAPAERQQLVPVVVCAVVVLVLMVAGIARALL